MASKSLCLASAGPPARRRETNHSPASNNLKGNNRNTNSNRNKNRRQHAPMPSAGGSRKLSESALGNELSDFTLDDPLETTRGRNRGRSANHLVSFQPQHQPVHQKNEKRVRTKSSRYHGSHGKEDHVQATGQFVVLDTAKLEKIPFMQNPNLAVPWKYVEAIKFHTNEPTMCPICLSPPIAAKAGRCGHAHCYSCILHLISIAQLDKKAQCPICHCGVKRDELRSIISGEETMPKSGVKLDFVKMTCSKDSINPSVVTSTDDDNDWLDRYQRLIPVSRDNLISNLLEREQAELAVQRAECEDSEIPFIEQAQDELNQRRASLELNVDLSDNSAVIESTTDDNHYFYQCANGSVIFLSSLNAKCMMHQYGSIKEAPDSLSGTVLEYEEFTMDAEIRRRFRYLAHLSDGQPFFIVHLDARDLGLSEETFLKFKDQILAKSRRKHQKDREESKAHKKFEEYYDRELYGKYTPADISLGDMDAFPSFDDSPESIEEIPKAAGANSPTWAGRENNTKPVFSSDDFFPTLGGEQPTGQSGSFWGQMKSTTQPKKYNSAPTVLDDDIDDELAYARRNNNNNLGDEIALALAAQKTEKPSESGVRGNKRGQKKKKGTKIAF